MNDKLEELRSEINDLAEKPELTTEEEARFDAAVVEFEELRDQIAKAEERARKVEEVRSFHAQGAVEPTIRTPEFKRSDDNPFDLSELRTMDPKQRDIKVRSKALYAIERSHIDMSDEARDTADRHVRRDATIAMHAVRTGSPEYHEAFFDYLRTGQVADELRASLSLTDANGGYLVPFTLDPTIILTNNGATNPFRSIASVETITTDTWNGVASAGVTAEWTAEAAQVADASPTFTQPSITPIRADAHVQASMEVTADAGLAPKLAALFADARDRLEATAFATGSGSTQPYGVVTRVGAITASRVAGTSEGLFGAVDVYKLANALPARYRANASFVAELTTINAIRQFDTYGGSSFWANLGMGAPEQLLGRPIYESSAMDGTITSGSTDDILIVGDFNHGYKIIDRIGMSVLYNPLVQGANNRPNGEVSWTAFWRVGADTVDNNAFRLLRI